MALGVVYHNPGDPRLEDLVITVNVDGFFSRLRDADYHWFKETANGWDYAGEVQVRTVLRGMRARGYLKTATFRFTFNRDKNDKITVRTADGTTVNGEIIVVYRLPRPFKIFNRVNNAEALTVILRSAIHTPLVEVLKTQYAGAYNNQQVKDYINGQQKRLREDYNIDLVVDSIDLNDNRTDTEEERADELRVVQHEIEVQIARWNGLKPIELEKVQLEMFKLVQLGQAQISLDRARIDNELYREQAQISLDRKRIENEFYRVQGVMSQFSGMDSTLGPLFVMATYDREAARAVADIVASSSSTSIEQMKARAFASYLESRAGTLAFPMSPRGDGGAIIDVGSSDRRQFLPAAESLTTAIRTAFPSATVHDPKSLGDGLLEYKVSLPGIAVSFQIHDRFVRNVRHGQQGAHTPWPLRDPLPADTTTVVKLIQDIVNWRARS